MVHFPSIPSWNGLHPLIIHFPIALLLIAPLFVIVGAVLPAERGRVFLASAFLLVLLGSAAIFLAAQTGEAAGEVADQGPAVKSVLAQHQSLAQTTQALFSALTLAFAALLFIPRLLHRELDPAFNAELLAAYLILYITGAIFLVNTAHQGARLVHEFGVTARVAAAAARSPQRD